MKFETVLDQIGKTPHLRLSTIFPEAQKKNIEVWIKLENKNPGGSIKDRIALAMIEDAEKRGLLTPETLIVEPTSGNTGVGLALVAAIKGYSILIVMPESMSLERRKLMTAYGAKLELTPKEKGMKGAIERAQEILRENPKAWMPMQFENKANREIHEQTTAKEILEDFPHGLDYLFAGVGTGGHFSACSKVLKEHFPKLQAFAVEPSASPVLSGGSPSPHPLQGIGAGFVPGNFKREYADGIVTIEKDEAFFYAQELAKKEGLLAGISTGAVLASIAKTIPTLRENTKLLCFAYDTGERYLSVAELY